jgi:hypothetical protein
MIFSFNFNAKNLLENFYMMLMMQMQLIINMGCYIIFSHEMTNRRLCNSRVNVIDRVYEKP